MFVTAFTDGVTELGYEPGQSPVFRIKSKTSDGKKNGYLFRTELVNRNFKAHVMGLISRLSGGCVCPP